MLNEKQREKREKHACNFVPQGPGGSCEGVPHSAPEVATPATHIARSTTYDFPAAHPLGREPPLLLKRARRRLRRQHTLRCKPQPNADRPADYSWTQTWTWIWTHSLSVANQKDAGVQGVILLHPAIKRKVEAQATGEATRRRMG